MFPSMTTPVTEITSKPSLFPDFREAWRSRQMAIALARRNIITRYTQTVFGYGWFVAQPLLLTGILTVILGSVLNAPSDGVPYLLFAFSGTTLWTTFNRSVNDTTVSLAATGGILAKVYFPRLFIPLAAVLTTIVELTPVYIVLFIGVAAYGRLPGWPLFALPLFVLLSLLLALAIGLWLTVLDAFYRDVRLAAPYALQFLFYLSPVIYSASAIPEKWRVVYRLNPLSALLEGFRWSLIAGAPAPDAIEIAWVVGLCAVLLLIGLIVFARFERLVVDRI
jgi:lipopolysaccharide transport system permease protein